MDATRKARLIRKRALTKPQPTLGKGPKLEMMPAAIAPAPQGTSPAQWRQRLRRAPGGAFVSRLYWTWPQALWRRLWPAINAMEAPWIVFAPWALVIALICLWRASVLLGPEMSALNVGIDTLVPDGPGMPALKTEEAAEAVGHFGPWSPLGVENVWALWSYRICLMVTAVVLGGPFASFLFLAPLHVTLQRLRKPQSNAMHSHGSARWGTHQDAVAETASIGFMLGRFCGKQGPEKDNKFRVKTHILTIAGSGAGKGVGAVIPNLLLYPGSVFVLDLKGELSLITARRRHELGHKVVVIDPFDITGLPAQACNWLDGVDPHGPRAMRDTEKLVDALIVRASGVEDSHWNDQAGLLLRGLILYAASLTEPHRNITTVRQILTTSSERRTKVLKKIAADTGLADGAAAASAQSFLSLDPKEQSGVLSTAVRHTKFLDDPNIQRALGRSDFSFNDLKNGKLTVYLVMSPDDLDSYRGFVRATLDLALRSCYRVRTKPKHDVLFLLDEFPVLGYVRPVERAISLVRGYGVRFWILAQTLDLLKAEYPKWGAFKATTMQFFGIQDDETSEYVSKILGKRTLVLRNASRSSSAHTQGRDSTQVGESTQHVARDLLTPAEVRELPEDQVIVLARGRRPQKLTRLNYLTDPEFHGMADPNPLEQQDHSINKLSETKNISSITNRA